MIGFHSDFNLACSWRIPENIKYCVTVQEVQARLLGLSLTPTYQTFS
jgi:hypothetical protein